MRCLVIGATGYVGARLVPRLLADGHEVRCLVRDAGRLARRQEWAGRVERVTGDATDPAAVAAACRDVDALYYLVHSMDGPGFAERDRRAASVTADAARAAGVARLVYLGGLEPAAGDGSPHLASRREVGELLGRSGVPTIVLQAGIVVGAGSASFEMIRQVAVASPVLPLPDRAWNRVQPVGIDDLLHHLVACLDLPPGAGGSFDVGGPDVLTYAELVGRCAEACGRPRPLVVPVPGAAPRLTARAVAALTPVDRHLAGPLLASMAYDLVCRDQPPTGEPPGGPTPYAEAVRRAVADESAGSGALVSEHVEAVDAPPRAVWEVVRGLGGDTGWYTVPGVWALRGALDRLLGGVGARRVRPLRLAPGAALDWWRVEAVEPGRSLRLRAEMRLPGVARLELRVEPAAGGSRLVQRVTFHPHGAVGRAYWYAQLPVHRFVFGVTARTIAGVAAMRRAPRRSARTRA
ncbi:MAG TPA: SDR family oxidoreductase [Pseudonocardia sp.]|nr:SDR family oxidoreductase [Pseudonocardia sp.]